MPRQIITCGACGETRPQAAHGWCSSCYRRWRYHGRPAGGPPPVRPMEHADVQGTVQGWDWHMRTGADPCGPCREAHNGQVLDLYHEKGRKRPLFLARHFTEPCTEWSPEQEQAAKTVASRVEDADGCRVLLQALGLLPYEVRSQDRIGGGRAVA